MKTKRRKKNKEGGQEEEEAVFDRIQQPTRAETPGKLGRDGDFLTLMKVTHKTQGYQ